MGIRQVMHLRVEADEELLGLRRGPVVTKVQRVIMDLPARAIAETMRPRPMTLPEHTGAGPCGTFARCNWEPRLVDPNLFMGQRFVGEDVLPIIEAPTPLAWSIRHLVEPLQHHYATHVEPMHFGAKTGPRGRRAA
jgi:hypothetical protein